MQAGLFEHNVTGDIIHVGELQYATDDQLRVTPTIPLSEVVLKRHPGRKSQELIVCDLTGCGAQDAAIAAVV